MSKKKCWIVRGTVPKEPIYVFDEITKYSHKFRRWFGKYGSPAAGWSWSMPPQLRKMWKKALGRKRGAKAICECDWETWRPIISNECNRCAGNSIPSHRPKKGECDLCGGAGVITHIMNEDDL